MVPVQFEDSTGNVHIDKAIEFATQAAMTEVKNVMAGAMARAMKKALEINSKYPPPPPGSVLRRRDAVDVICQCGRCVTFPLHEVDPQNDPDHPRES